MNIVRIKKNKLKWSDILKFKDDYRWSIVQVQEYGNDLYFKFSGCLNTRYAVYMVINDYKRYTAVEILNGLEKVGFNTRHSHDAITRFYKEKNLDLGYTVKILKPCHTNTYGLKRK